jgi:hypothetical protein
MPGCHPRCQADPPPPARPCICRLNEALLAKAAGRKLLRTARVRADTTVIAANVAYPTDSGLLARAVGKLTRTVRRVQAAGGATGSVMTWRFPPPDRNLAGPQDHRARPRLPPRLRLGPHPPGRQERSGDLVRTRGIRPQPGQGQRTSRLIPPRTTRITPPHRRPNSPSDFSGQSR